MRLYCGELATWKGLFFMNESGSMVETRDYGGGTERGPEWGAWVEWPEGEVEEVADGGEFWLLAEGSHPYLSTRPRCYCLEIG